MTRITDIDEIMFPVELHPVYTEIGSNGTTNKIEVKNSKAVVNTKSGTVLGVVNKNYELITNSEAVELGKKCCAELFGLNEATNINVFKIDAPSTASYCHIDLVHDSYRMNLWDEAMQSDVYVPYVRITNSYNTSRALRFDIGFCREICLNGVIFEHETITFTFSHLKREIRGKISFTIEAGKIKVLFDRFVSYVNKLRTYNISKDDSFQLILALFGIKDASEIDFHAKNENYWEYEGLLNIIKTRLEKYIKETGENAYSLFNAITDLASNPIQRNRYFRKDMNSMERLAGRWMNSFQTEIDKSSFDIAEYLKTLREETDKTLHRTGNRYAVADE